MENNLDELIPLYHEYSDTKIFKETRIRYVKAFILRKIKKIIFQFFILKLRESNEKQTDEIL